MWRSRSLLKWRICKGIKKCKGKESLLQNIRGKKACKTQEKKI